MLSSSAQALITNRGHQRALDSAGAGKIHTEYVLVVIARSAVIRPANRERGTSFSLRIYSARRAAKTAGSPAGVCLSCEPWGGNGTNDCVPELGLYSSLARFSKFCHL
ncbi:uncharacterized protein TRAVEDRAFT_26582 [Trametes versicolor FP-101664 SS1]|uniref:uncharacterized protein n=1 Tax=Trametes versicolor (strain FP-101664) TaxID=717944 RepID=UPI0004623675|nr:uncharacterized protein TRAVEDRAFT_26582 [Trametes versicolor FP-101664 SS1]EIW63197.1 hypothetical protein TRAVEDRAFT_26582 [Trametes versicolor FP-101664 SS1]